MFGLTIPTLLCSSDTERLVIDTDQPTQAKSQPTKRIKVIESDSDTEDDKRQRVESDADSDIDDKVGDIGTAQPRLIKRVTVVESDDSDAESNNGGGNPGITSHTELGESPVTV